MSVSARTSILWGDGEHPARLTIDGARELQQKTGVGPYALLRRMLAGDWQVDDFRETIRIGLIGGGMEPHTALVAVMRYADARPWLESIQPAMTILQAALSGEEEEKKTAGKSPAKRPKTTTAASASPRSSATGRSSGSRRAKSAT